MLVNAFLAGTVVCGIGFAFGAHRFRDWVVAVYDNPRVTKHLMVPGYVISVRVVGIAFLATSLFLLLSLRRV